jgi:hypothetical protein
MPSLSTLFGQWLGPDRIHLLAERVAGRSRMAVWQRVIDRLPQLGPIEGRGYLRARGISIVREEMDRLLQQEGATLAGIRVEIEEAALQMLIDVIATQLRQPRQQQIGRRRAA